jgi:hypothetical protein
MDEDMFDLSEAQIVLVFDTHGTLSIFTLGESPMKPQKIRDHLLAAAREIAAGALDD